MRCWLPAHLPAAWLLFVVLLPDRASVVSAQGGFEPASTRARPTSDIRFELSESLDNVFFTPQPLGDFRWEPSHRGSMAERPASSENPAFFGKIPGEKEITRAGYWQDDLPSRDGIENNEFERAETETPPVDRDESLISTADSPQPSTTSEPKWYEKLRIRGYSQLRYNQLGLTNPNLRSAQGDRSIGEKNGFFLRRARMVFSGDISDSVSVYIQPDFASSASSDGLHFAQLRDWYADIALDSDKEFRFRVGQSKVPYGFENLQSSQNRLALDRNDALNSGVLNERDLGVFFYWAPDEVRERFKYLVDSGLKGSGDYGVLGLGIYNGQTANRPERNDDRHFVARLSYPILFENGQIFEPGLGGYTGIFTIDRDPTILGGNDFIDRRMAVSAVLYPQPWGLQGEYTWGEGPQLNSEQTAVEVAPLRGGYAQIFYQFQTLSYGTLFPFCRWQYYDGGRKHEANAPRNRTDETELGIEWQPARAIELTCMYTITDRTSSVRPYRNEAGSLIRIQLQINY
jgi:hypothetical protein